MQIAFATVYRNKRPNLPASLPQPLEKLVKVLSTAAVSVARAGRATPYYPLLTAYYPLLTTLLLAAHYTPRCAGRATPYYLLLLLAAHYTPRCAGRATLRSGRPLVASLTRCAP